ncbi:MAG: phosphoribosylformylglycinamidine cyclo-ligase [Planctomycetota bacterium]|nr:phosphoribosylformylglycinamidine cyclo-ligase [Planctomycetota bacterium]
MSDYTGALSITKRRSKQSPRGLTYADSGVDIDAGDRVVPMIKTLLRKTHGPRVIGQHGAFAGMFRLDYNEKLFKRNYKDPVLVACTDGVGTKVKLAAQLGIHITVGIDCVAMNVNDLIVQGAEPLFFLDYLGLHKQVPEETTMLIEGVAKGCEIAGCALLGGECAEMPDVYAEGDFDIAGFAVGVVELKRAIDPMRVEVGDVVIGLASDGIHSNGYSLVRKIVKKAKLKLDRVYPEIGEETLGEILLTPTRIYVQPILKLLRKYRVKKVVSGMAHITGGGLPGNLNRALTDTLDARINFSAWDIPPLFHFLQQKGGVETDEMLRVFNMGIGYVLIVRPTFANSIITQLNNSGEKATILGEIVKGTGQVQLI